MSETPAHPKAFALSLVPDLSPEERAADVQLELRRRRLDLRVMIARTFYDTVASTMPVHDPPAGG